MEFACFFGGFFGFVFFGEEWGEVEKKRKNTVNLSSAELAQGVVMVRAFRYYCSCNCSFGQIDRICK